VSIKRATFNFIKLSELTNREPNTLVDVVGVVQTAYDVQSITTKDGRELQKKDMV
jgi:hypothetical protein